MPLVSNPGKDLEDRISAVTDPSEAFEGSGDEIVFIHSGQCVSSDYVGEADALALAICRRNTDDELFPRAIERRLSLGDVYGVAER